MDMKLESIKLRLLINYSETPGKTVLVDYSKAWTQDQRIFGGRVIIDMDFKSVYFLTWSEESIPIEQVVSLAKDVYPIGFEDWKPTDEVLLGCLKGIN